ncbi:MAG TPA: GatB/YqeY domain-containing protein [Gammaproteobacteria bacterium]|nr:GatB/YqeY domain-containing protein [Gammaproteobacteria bacterium]
MTATIKDNIIEDMKAAMRSQEKERLGAIRLILAALKQREIDERILLTNEQILATLNKMIKQRRDSISQFEAGNRPDLVQKETEEIRIIQHYLPAQLSMTDIDQAIATAIQESGANSAKDMGKIMGILKTKLQGKADMAIVSAKVKEQLAKKTS